MQTYCSNTTRRWVLSLQRDGRILRQGNMFDEVYVYRYVTENTFDAYMWQTQENKQKFITQIITNKSAVRSCEDVDGAVLDCAEVKMLATGDCRVKEKMQLDNDIYVLQVEKSAHLKERIKLQTILTDYPQRIANANEKLQFTSQDIQMLSSNKNKDFVIEIDGTMFDDRVKAGEMLNTLIKINSSGSEFKVGNYCGFELTVEKSSFFETTKLHIKGNYDNIIDLGGSDLGNITRIENGCASLETVKQHTIENIEVMKKQISDAESELAKPFERETELQEKLQRQVALNSEMEMNTQASIIMKEDDETHSTELEENNQSLSDRLNSSNKKADIINQNNRQKSKEILEK